MIYSGQKVKSFVRIFQLSSLLSAFISISSEPASRSSNFAGTKMFKIESWTSRKVKYDPEITPENQGVVIYTANVKTKQGLKCKVL